MIQNIAISKLHPHYDNPRKDLGDLTELAESIKANGIFQNLTVVPWFSKITGVGCDDPKQQEEMGYTVVIGHRRLAAAKLAGLTEVPCAISNMNMHDQISTMLLENMQRSDLTVYEQAQGFQMMLDLGDSVDEISKRTGFSETTVRRRVKLLELDNDKFRESVGRGATLMDYLELDKIQNNELKNSVLDKIGTSNFKFELQRAIDKEKNEHEMSLLIDQVKAFASQIDNSTGLRWIGSYYGRDHKNFKKPDGAGSVKYYFVVSNYGYITLYTESEEKKDDAANEQREMQEKKKEVHAALEEITKRTYKLRHDFIFGISSTSAKRKISVIMEYSLRAMLNDCYSLDYEQLAEALDIEISEDDDEWTYEKISNQLNSQLERSTLIAIYMLLDSPSEHYYNWNNQHTDNESLNTVYDFLEKFGYEMSDEERMLRDGTHDLFAS